MSTFYTNIAKVSLRLIKEKGQLCQRVILSDDYDPIEGSASDTTSASEDVNGAFFPTTFSKTFDADLVRKASEIVLLDPLSLTSDPKAGHIIVKASGQSVQVLAVDTLAPSGTPVLHTCLVERYTRELP